MSLARKFKSLFKKAEKERQSGNWNKAARAYREILKIDPNNLDGHYLLGSLLAERGELKEGKRHLQQAALLAPQSPWIANNLGNIHRLEEDHAQALKHYRTALALQPDTAQFLYNLGMTLIDLGENEEALSALDDCLAVDPSFFAAINPMGSLLYAQGRYEEAIQLYRMATVLNPDDMLSHYNLGYALRDAGQKEEAIISFRRTLELDPENSSAQLILASLTGETPESMPDSYVAGLFDQYAGHFESDLQDRLKYNVPKLMRNVWQEKMDNRKVAKALDAGCGTGLVGANFASVVESFTGLDISQKMVEAARSSGWYQQVVCSPVIDFLKKTEERFDLFLFADVLVYVGDLDPLFSLVVAHAAPEARMLFSVEDPDESQTGLQLKTTARFGHSHDYLVQLAECHNCELEYRSPIEVRQERSQPVKGALYMMKCR